MVVENAERMGSRSCTSCAAASAAVLRRAPASCFIRIRFPSSRASGSRSFRDDRRLRDRAPRPAFARPRRAARARQSGVPMLRFADLETDLDLLEAARDAAQRILPLHPAIASAICSAGSAASSNICGSSGMAENPLPRHCERSAQGPVRDISNLLPLKR